MWKLIGIIGLIVMAAGIDLLWQSRREVRFWTVTFVGIFRALLRQQRPQDLLANNDLRWKRRHAARVFVGASLALVLGPILLALGVTLMVLYPNL
jgi:hypothetical protein